MAREPLVGNWFRTVVFSSVAGATVYLAAVLWVGRSEVSASLKLVGADSLIALLALSMLNYGVRFGRWHYYLWMLGSSISVRHNLRIYIGGFALTTTPGKAGEMARSLWLRPYGVPAATSLAAFFTERIQDVIAVALLSSLGVSLYQGAAWLLWSSLGLCVTGIIFLQAGPVVDTVLRFMAGRSAPLLTAARRISKILALTRACMTPVPFMIGLSSGLLAWSAEAFGFFMLLRSLGHPVPLLGAISVFTLSMLAGALSFMPGGLGGSEATMIILLKLLGVPLASAVAATLLIQLATLWFAVLLGIIALSIVTKLPRVAPASI